MTKGLERWYGGHDLHFITCSCYKRRPELGTGERRDLLLRVLEQARQKYRFVVIGYVVMPEHFHLLITEPDVGDPSVVMRSSQGAIHQAASPWRHGQRSDLAKALL